MQTIAVLGLGVMGSGISKSLLRAGFPVIVYNRTPSRADEIAALGAQKADTVAQAAQQAYVIISMVSDDPVSRTIWLGEAGVLQNAKPGAILIEMSTLSLDWIHELAAQAKAHSFDFLHAPVSGSRDAAANGKLRLYAGGDAAVLERVHPILDAISSVRFHVGDVGAAASVKLVMNTLVAAQLASLAEALTLGEQLGIDRSHMAEIMDGATSTSGLMQFKMNGMVTHAYGEAQFKLSLILKDVRYALKAGHEVSLPVLEAIQKTYEAAESQGLGENDASAVAEVKHSKG